MDGAGVVTADEQCLPSHETVNEAAYSCGGDPCEDGKGEEMDGKGVEMDGKGEEMDGKGEEMDGKGEEMDESPAAGQSDGRYAYVDRGFTSELYKLEVCNLPKHIGYQVRLRYTLECSIKTYALQS